MENETTENTSPNANMTPGQTASIAKRFNFPADLIAKTVESMPDEHRREIKWLAGFGRERNLGADDLGGMLKQGSGEPYSGASIYALFTGRREEGSVAKLCESIRALRLRMEETAPHNQALFIQTSLTKRIWTTCETALRRRKLSFIFGPSQIGKTTALSQYAVDHNHGETCLVRMPTRGSLADFLNELGSRLNISTQSRHSDMRRRIIESFDERTLLIVDECHQCLASHYSDRSLASLEFCRELWDRRKCGMVLCGTDIFRDGLRNSKVLRQLWLRGYRPLQLPPAPTAANLVDFSAAYGLQPARDANIEVTATLTDDSGATVRRKIVGNPIKIERDTIRDFGLGRWLAILEDASELARERGEKNSWPRVIVAHAQFRDLEAQTAG